MGNLAAIELQGLITKPYLKSVIKKELLVVNPELANLITEKVIVKCLIYISGYIKCFTYHGIQPMNTKEVQNLLVQECLDWIKEYVINGGK